MTGLSLVPGRLSGAWRASSPVLRSMVALMAVAVVVRIPFFPYAAYLSIDPPLTDAAVWQLWSRVLWERGLDDLSQVEPKTYVGYHYVFWLIAQVYGRISPDFEIGTRSLLYLTKVPPVLFDLALVPLIFAATRRAARLLPESLAQADRLAPLRWLATRGVAPHDALGLAAAALFVLSPAAVYDSAVWAQSESVISFFMLGAILALVSGQPGWAWALWAVGLVVKPQPVVIVPALAAFTFWRFGWPGVVRGAAGAAGGGFAMLAYFLFTGNGPYIWDVYQELFRIYDRHISINAWNLWWSGHLNGLRASDALLSFGAFDLTVEGASFVLLVAATLVSLAYLHVRRDLVGLLVSCAVLEFAFYLFPISTHERYLYPLFVFLAPLAVLQARWLVFYLPLSIVFFLNIFFASPTDPDIFETYLESGFGQAMAALNVAAFVVVAALLVRASWRARPWPNPLRPAAAPAS